jgi:protein-S-isoprenylcysteine O-methyltransferase Ste14
MNRAKAILASYIGVVLFSAFIFLGAWKFWYWQGLLYLAIAIIGTTINHLLLSKGSTLTEERAKTAKDGLAWDKKILGVTFLVSLATFFVAGLDSGRFLWSGDVPLILTFLGVFLVLLGQVIFAFAKRENAFFSSTVRLQTEMGHRVCSTGVYQTVRHPGYLGLIISNLGFPLVMNSYYSFIPTVLGISLIVVRTILEDRFLKENLDGYREYAGKTTMKLIPWIY